MRVIGDSAVQRGAEVCVCAHSSIVLYFIPDIQRVVVALTLRAHITTHRILTGFAVHARAFLLGIAHAGRGELGPYRFDRCPRFGVEQSVDAAHAVRILLVDGQIAPPRPLGIVRRITVLVEQQRQPVSGRAELRRAEPVVAMRARSVSA